jgi:carbonic anhydrase/acetyltransferase-like protein (isoleucine patch superfamily)
MPALIQPYAGVLPRIDARAFVADNAVVVGDVEIAEDVGLWYGVIARGDVNFIRIGARSNIQDGTVIHCAYKKYPTIVGADVLVGHLALLHACEIGDGAFVGMKACVMDGAVVEPGAMVAAGALVTPRKVVKSGQLWGGSPAKYIRDLTDQDREQMRWAVGHYVKLAHEYRAMQAATKIV